MKLAVITFVFNEYDFPRKPYFCDNVEYICITDKPYISNGWKIIVDQRLCKINPIYASYYVRYHPQEYTDADIIMVIDASLQITNSLQPLFNQFIASDKEIGVTIGGFLTNTEKIDFWNRSRRQISKTNYILAETALRDNSIIDILGTTVSTVKLIKNTDNAIKFNEYVWALCLRYGIDGNPNRLDEIFVDIALNGLFCNMSVFTMCVQILYGNPFDYCSHGTNKHGHNYADFNKYMFRNKPVHPVCIGPEYPTSYKYKTEAMLLTKYMQPQDLEFWLDWHLNKIGFEHIHVFGNELQYDAGAVCSKFGSRVSFENVQGIPRQYKLYDRYLAIQSEAEWVMPIDDDEFLTFDETMFGNIYEAIQYYDEKLPNMEILAVRWLHLFPETFHSERDGQNLIEYCNCRSPEIAAMFEPAGDNCVKSIVHRYGWIHYEETVENPGGGHVPRHSNAKAAVGFDGTRISSYCYRNDPADTSDEKIRLIHCRYWGYSEYCDKYRKNASLRVSDASHRAKQWKFDRILDRLP